MAVEPENVMVELEILFDNIVTVTDQKLSKLEMIFYASLIHLRIAQIYPFVDNNGKIARLVEKWFLAQFLGKVVWSYQPEQYYWENRAEYYKRINLGQDYYNLNFEKSVEFANFVLEGYLQ